MKRSFAERQLSTGRCFHSVVALTAFLTCAVAVACNVPVFRYALEHWHPDNYRAVIIHRGELLQTDRELVKVLEQLGRSNRVNISVRTLDFSSPETAMDRELQAICPEQQTPCLILQYPDDLGLHTPVWIGQLTSENIQTLVDSSARQQLLKRLTEGQTAVWLLLESGDETQDAAALAILSEEVKALEKTLKLPELTDAPEDAILDGPDLRVQFSILRVRRDDVTEQGLTTTLLAAESDLKDIQEPMVFPVFGRGRVMLPLVGPGISGSNIRASASFLAGGCSCQVKELNPGFDLLLSADWNDLLGWADSPELAKTTQAAGKNAEPVLVPIPEGKKQTTAMTPNAPNAPASASFGEPVASPATPPANDRKKNSQDLLLVIAGLAIMATVMALFGKRD